MEQVSSFTTASGRQVFTLVTGKRKTWYYSLVVWSFFKMLVVSHKKTLNLERGASTTGSGERFFASCTRPPTKLLRIVRH